MENNGTIPIRSIFDNTIDSRNRAEILVLFIKILIDKIV